MTLKSPDIHEPRGVRVSNHVIQQTAIAQFHTKFTQHFQSVPDSASSWKYKVTFASKQVEVGLYTITPIPSI